VVRPAIGTGCRWQSRKKEGEENLQEREGGPTVYALPLVRSWVDGNDGGKAGCGGGGRCCCCRYWRMKKMKMMVLMGYCRCGGKRRCFQWRGINVVERVEDELVAAWLGVTESTVERERLVAEKEKKLGRRLVFLSTLDSIFSSIKPSTSPLFIGGGRG
jgi:hypothetical protein